MAGTEADGEGSVASLTPLPPPPTAQEVSSRYPALEGGTNGGWHVVCRYRLRILPLLEGADAASSGAGAADAPQTDVLPPTTVMTRFQLHLPSLAARPYFKIVTTETDHTTYVMVTCVVTYSKTCVETYSKTCVETYLKTCVETGERRIYRRMHRHGRADVCGDMCGDMCRTTRRDNRTF